MNPKLKNSVCSVLVLASWIYLVLLFGWLGVYIITGDRFLLVALVNYLAVYFFYPLVLVLVTAILCQKRIFWIGFLIGGVVFIWFWGAQFVPRINQNRSDNITLSVMTYNVLAWHDHTESILVTIRAENPDILAIQELNFNLAEAIQLNLGEIYPYQVLEPSDDPTGIGVFSKFPIRSTGEKLPQRWIGGPQVLELEWNGDQVTLVNFHMTPTTGVFPAGEQTQRFRMREAEALLLADLARRSDTVIMAGDANTSSLSDAYQIITSELEDSFRQSGFGLGHTFPGSDIPESDRPQIAGWYVPTWMARIDYVFHSHDWETISSRTARIDGVSDHRGVLSVLKRSQ